MASIQLELKSSVPALAIDVGTRSLEPDIPRQQQHTVLNRLGREFGAL